MNNRPNQPDRGDDHPVFTEDAVRKQNAEQDTLDESSAAAPGDRGDLSIVPAPRRFAYRRPVGHPDEDNTLHPLRRRSDFDPQK